MASRFGAGTGNSPQQISVVPPSLLNGASLTGFSQSGHGCIGCSEGNFWDNGPFYRHLPNFPGFGIETTADKIGVGLGAATVVGIAAHAISTNIRKRHLIKEEQAASEDVKDGRAEQGGS